MTQILLAAGFVLAAGVLPGAMLFRLPLASRDSRAALPADERVFWYVFLSISWSVAVAFALAFVSAYSLPRLLLINSTPRCGVVPGKGSQFCTVSVPLCPAPS